MNIPSKLIVFGFIRVKFQITRFSGSEALNFEGIKKLCRTHLKKLSWFGGPIYSPVLVYEFQTLFKRPDFNVHAVCRGFKMDCILVALYEKILTEKAFNMTFKISQVLLVLLLLFITTERMCDLFHAPNGLITNYQVHFRPINSSRQNHNH